MRGRTWLRWVGLVVFGVVTITAGAQARMDFSGLWQQDNDHCQPQCKGDVTLRIEHHGVDLVVETSMKRDAGNIRHAVQKYTIDGKVSVSTGADGDEFHTAVVWKGASLVFSIEEHEDGRILISKETWSLDEDGATLERVREAADGKRRIVVYRKTANRKFDGLGMVCPG